MAGKIVAIAEINRDELLVQFLEIGVGLIRPQGQSASEFVAEIKALGPNKVVDDFEAMAHAAIVYVTAQIKDARPVS